MKISRRWLAALCGSLLFAACIDPITVGSDLLEQDRADVGFTDTLLLEAVTEPDQTLLSYNGSVGTQLTSRYLFGALQDDIFGLNRASIYLVPRLQRNNIFQVIRPAFANRQDVTIDSVVLVLPTDTIATYGNPDAPHPWKITIVSGLIDPRENYRTNATFPLNFEPEGRGSFVPNGDSLLVSPLDVPSLGDSVQRPHVRLPLSLDLGRTILQADSTLFESDTLFQENILSGLYLEPDAITPGIVDFNLDPPWGGLHIYYTLDGEADVYVFPADPVTTINAAVNRYEQDFTGSYAARFFDDFLADSLIFVEGMGGLRTRLELPDLQSLDGQVVNQAELEFTVRRFAGIDYSLFPIPEALSLQYRNEDGELEYIDDIRLSLNGTETAFFGGLPRVDPVTGDLIYRMNISVHLQRIIDREYAPVLYLVTEPKLGNPQRTALFGPSSMRSPVRLKVAFTKL